MASLTKMIRVLETHGPRFTGNAVADEAQDWIDFGFTATSADAWCEIGVWDAETASKFRDAGLSAADVARAAELLTEGLDYDEQAETFTDGDPIYSCCNGDTPVQMLIDAARGILG